MLADSLATSTGWLTFVAVVGASVALPSLVARICRRFLPPDRRDPTPLEPLAFGSSPKTRRAPRHAMVLYPSLITSSFVIALGLVLIPFAAAIRRVGLEGVLVAIAFAAPALLVALHAKRRGAGT